MLYVYTFPNHTGGAPLVLLVRLHGAGDSKGLEDMLTVGLESLTYGHVWSEWSVKTLSWV